MKEEKQEAMRVHSQMDVITKRVAWPRPSEAVVPSRCINAAAVVSRTHSVSSSIGPCRHWPGAPAVVKVVSGQIAIWG